MQPQNRDFRGGRGSQGNTIVELLLEALRQKLE